MRWRRAPRPTLPEVSKPAPCTDEYDETVRHILGPPGALRLTAAAVWYAHEIAWRPLVESRGAAHGTEAVSCLEPLAGSHGYTAAEVLDAAGRSVPTDERRSADR